ncbi:unnamed protein product [Caenorhabditis auriculariae]|uniref:C-type lectin domain-containing protein n=1 Tax=Caenorhabditis auriculariae TaxID=2777116 RepID=A0A8S1H2T3_9PELO|nr:unnamed protein product [Caenorhabditis auriculariae]
MWATTAILFVVPVLQILPTNTENSRCGDWKEFPYINSSKILCWKILQSKSDLSQQSAEKLCSAHNSSLAYVDSRQERFAAAEYHASLCKPRRDRKCSRMCANVESHSYFLYERMPWWIEELWDEKQVSFERPLQSGDIVFVSIYLDEKETKLEFRHSEESRIVPLRMICKINEIIFQADDDSSQNFDLGAYKFTANNNKDLTVFKIELKEDRWNVFMEIEKSKLKPIYDRKWLSSTSAADIREFSGPYIYDIHVVHGGCNMYDKAYDPTDKSTSSVRTKNCAWGSAPPFPWIPIYDCAAIVKNVTYALCARAPGNVDPTTYPLYTTAKSPRNTTVEVEKEEEKKQVEQNLESPMPEHIEWINICFGVFSVVVALVNVAIYILF